MPSVFFITVPYTVNNTDKSHIFGKYYLPFRARYNNESGHTLFISIFHENIFYLIIVLINKIV